MPIIGLHHAAIICSDYERAKKFYTEVLRFRVISEIFREDRRSWKLDLEIPGSVRIELFSFPSPPPRTSFPEACGLRHLAFAVDDVADEVLRLKTHGVDAEPIRTDPVTGRKFTFFADPDGLPLELYES